MRSYLLDRASMRRATPEEVDHAIAALQITNALILGVVSICVLYLSAYTWVGGALWLLLALASIVALGRLVCLLKENLKSIRFLWLYGDATANELSSICEGLSDSALVLLTRKFDL